MCSFSYSIWLVFRDLKHQTSSATTLARLDLGGFSGHGAGQWWAGGERGHGASPGGSGADVFGIVAEGRGKICWNVGNPMPSRSTNLLFGMGDTIHGDFDGLWHWVYHGLPHWNLMHAGCLAIYAWHGLVCIRGAHESLLLLVRKRSATIPFTNHRSGSC